MKHDVWYVTGVGTDGLVCVKFGLITPGMQLEELVEYVLATGHEIEQTTKVL